MEIKWEKMDYIAFILLGMLTIFCGNKQLQQLVAGLYIALAIWYVYTIIYEVKRYKPCTLLTSSTGDTTSPNAEVKMSIENNRSPKMPLTGGQGMVLMLVAGVGLVVGGTCVANKKKKENVAC